MNYNITCIIQRNTQVVLVSEFVCGIGPNSSGDFEGIFKSGPTCIAGALGAAAVKLTTLS